MPVYVCRRMANTLSAWMVHDDGPESLLPLEPERTMAATFFLRWREGDTSAFDQLVGALHPMAFRVALRLLGNREDTEDAVQELFLRLYRAGGGIRNPAGLEAWVYRSTVNVVRSRQARVSKRVDSVGIEAALTTTDNRTDTNRTLWLRDALQHALQALSLKEREVLVLRDIEGLEIREVAAAMRVLEVTVRTHLCRARLKLRQELGARGIHP